MNILVGGAWIYANGSMHIGHLAALLPGDVIARYYRLKRHTVCFVSGSDCHGTPITLRAKKEGKSPLEISEKYHEEFVKAFQYLGFQYDYYGKTSSEGHKNYVKDFHEKLYRSKYIFEKEEPQAYCLKCNRFLPDRLVIGVCPNCGAVSRGDQCDACSNVFQPEELLDIYCSQCHEEPDLIKSKHLYLALSQLKGELEELLNKEKGWRKNAIAFTRRYIDEGLRDRAITRDLEWGIEVPKDGYEDKKIYIWAENVLGYLSSCYLYCQENELEFEDFWKKETKHYYIHGKDNVPFHSIILPGLLLAQGDGYHLPDILIASEYMTLEGKKISTSEDYAIWIRDLIGRYNPDAIRYFFISNGPEKRDADFSWYEFFNANNGELLGAYGNFVNRTLVFLKKSFNSEVPDGVVNYEIELQIKNLYQSVGKLIEGGELKRALKRIFDFIRQANKYFDDEKPWITVKTDICSCQNTLFNCVQIIANLAIILEPFLPFSSDKVIQWFGLAREWKLHYVTISYKIPEIDILFERLNKNIIEDEINKLRKGD